MLCAIGRPYRKQMMIGVLEGAAATQSDEPDVSLLWQYHSSVPRRCFCPTAGTTGGERRWRNRRVEGTGCTLCGAVRDCGDKPLQPLLNLLRATFMR
jgi:hypothetical protein